MQTPASKKMGLAALSLGAAFVLQGCVAAAIPLAAGGVITERQASRNKADKTDPSQDATTLDPSVQIAQSNADVGAINSDPINSDLAPITVATNPAKSGDPGARQPIQASQEQAEPRARPQFALAPQISGSNLPPAALPTTPTAPAGSASPSVRDAEPVRPPAPQGVQLSPAVRPLPATTPNAAPEPALSTRAPISETGSAILNPTSSINQFLSYANNRQIGSEESPMSAMLSDRIALTPERAECSGIAPTILIDLDPEGALFDSTTASNPPSGLARGLAQLRLNGVSIAWISGNSIDKLDAITRSLRYTGLDLNNEDRVLLVRGPGDRKHALREELSQITCLIAIAGDTRSDFDELYNYLKNPADANSLEPLIGDGWFLIPQPLISTGSEE